MKLLKQNLTTSLVNLNQNLYYYFHLNLLYHCHHLINNYFYLLSSGSFIFLLQLHFIFEGFLALGLFLVDCFLYRKFWYVRLSCLINSCFELNGDRLILVLYVQMQPQWSLSQAMTDSIFYISQCLTEHHKPRIHLMNYVSCLNQATKRRILPIQFQ